MSWSLRCVHCFGVGRLTPNCVLLFAVALINVLDTCTKPITLMYVVKIQMEWVTRVRYSDVVVVSISDVCTSKLSPNWKLFSREYKKLSKFYSGISPRNNYPIVQNFSFFIRNTSDGQSDACVGTCKSEFIHPQLTDLSAHVSHFTYYVLFILPRISKYGDPLIFIFTRILTSKVVSTKLLNAPDT